MQGSGFFRLGWQDLARGLVVAVLGAVLTAAQQAWQNNVDPTTWDWRTIGGIALGAGIAYLAKNLLSTEDGKFAGRIGAWALLVGLALGVSACGSSGGATSGGPVTGGDAVDPCAQAGQVLAGSSLAITAARSTYVLLEATGKIHPKPDTDLLIQAAFTAANTALAQAQADRAAGRCDTTAAVLAINAALDKAAIQVAAAKAAEQAAAAAAKAAKAAQQSATTAAKP